MTRRIDQGHDLDGHRFRKVPVEVTARQLEEPTEIETPEGVMEADAGDWLIEGVEGELYACKDSVFRGTYSPAETAAMRAIKEGEK